MFTGETEATKEKKRGGGGGRVRCDYISEVNIIGSGYSVLSP